MIKLPDFILIPYQLLEDKDISLVDERLYGVIYWLTKLKNEKCTASNTTLAEVVKTSSGMIRNSLMKLDKKGYIQRTFKDSKKKIRLEIIPLVVFAKVSAVNDSVSLGSDNVSLVDDSRVSLGSEQNKNTYNKNNKEDTLLNKLSDNNSPLKEKNDKDYDHFLIWYGYYPRKVGKPNAYKAWKRLKPDTELKRKMVLMVLEHSKSKQWQSPDFIPYPATWINQERWNDTLPQEDENT